MALMALKLGLAGLAALGLLFAGGTAHAETVSTTPGREPTPPPDLLGKIDGAYKSADPTVLRAVAAELEKAGYAVQAADLTKMAATIEAAIKSGVKAPPANAVPSDTKTPGVAPPLVFPPLGQPPVTVSPPPLTQQPPLAPPEDANRLLAGQTALHLKMAHKGSEDQTLVERFQDANGLKPDGKYGPAAALVLAQKFGIVPPKPYYWPGPYGTMVNTQKSYRSALIAMATKDPQRSDEWMAAAKAIVPGKP
ncbi:MAG TPA: hypothetical protein VF420_13385 [Casimicrobiaceae bacterium]